MKGLCRCLLPLKGRGMGPSVVVKTTRRQVLLAEVPVPRALETQLPPCFVSKVLIHLGSLGPLS